MDFAKAFPSTSWVAIRAALEAFHVPDDLIGAIMAIYNDKLRAYVRCPEFNTDMFNISVGTLQGDVLAPYLFVLVVDRIMATALVDLQTEFPAARFGIQLQRRQHVYQQPICLTDLAFADDIALITLKPDLQEARESAQRLLNAIVRVAARANLKMKAGETKTAIMVFGLGQDMPAADPEVRITLGPAGPVVPVVQQYKYLGRVFDHKLGINDTVIAQRIGGAYCAINKLRPVWDSPLSVECKEKLFECFVRPALVFSCASWLLTKAQLQRIDRAFTRMRRIALKIRKFATTFPDPNPRCTRLSVIYQTVRGEFADAASTTILRTKLRLFGHVLRRNVPLRYTLFWEPEERVYGKRKVGGRRRSILDDYLLLLPADVQFLAMIKDQKTITSRAVMPSTIVSRAADRHRWKDMIFKAGSANNTATLRLQYQGPERQLSATPKALQTQ